MIQQTKAPLVGAETPALVHRSGLAFGAKLLQERGITDIPTVFGVDVKSGEGGDMIYRVEHDDPIPGFDQVEVPVNGQTIIMASRLLPETKVKGTKNRKACSIRDYVERHTSDIKSLRDCNWELNKGFRLERWESVLERPVRVEPSKQNAFHRQEHVVVMKATITDEDKFRVTLMGGMARHGTYGYGLVQIIN